MTLESAKCAIMPYIDVETHEVVGWNSHYTHSVSGRGVGDTANVAH